MLECQQLLALLSLSSWCLVSVVWLFLAVPCICLQFVIVVFPDLTHLPFLLYNKVGRYSFLVTDSAENTAHEKCPIRGSVLCS